MKIAVGILSASLLCVGCVTTDGQEQPDVALNASGQQASSDTDGKQSLNELLDEHNRVTLVDDDTGETRLICRKVKRSQGRFDHMKVCGTKKQWRDAKQEAEDEVDKMQRSLTNAR